ncbi:hypothetical protein DFH09DRAFT_1365995 [Mycena vulgaris]|nr:hypothetical protein DFH09DRAFT_1365995 [Mycena vulgaris]
MTSPALDGTLGALEIGTVIGVFLFGMATLQTFNYYGQFPEDSKILKVTVAVIWFLELGHTICSLHGIYSITVTFYGQPPEDAFLKPPPSIVATLLFSGTIDALVQLFFGNRIRVLSGRPIFLVISAAFATLRFVCDITLAARLWIDNAGFTILRTKVLWEMITASSIGPAGDIFIAVVMCHWLWQRRDTGSHFNRTRRMVDTLIIWTIETTLVTSIAGIMQLVLILARNDLTFIPFYLIQPKLFLNAMLAGLNRRTRFRRGGEDFVSGSISLATRRDRSDGDANFSTTVPRIKNGSVHNVVVEMPSTTGGSTTGRNDMPKTEIPF